MLRFTKSRIAFSRIGLLAGFAFFGCIGTVQSADITFLCASAWRPATPEIIAEFQKRSGHKVNISFATIGVNADRIRNGDAADLAIVSPQQWQDLQRDGKIDATVRPMIAKVGIGVIVGKGRPRPDIGSADAFKRALLDSRSVAVPVSAGNPVAAYATILLNRLGIAAEIQAKNVVAGGGSPIQAVARGDADISFTQISELIAAPGVDYIGPLPPELQHYTIYAPAIPKNATEPAAAKALVEFLASTRGLALLEAKGFQAP